MRTFLLVALFAQPALPALADITVTNDRGGSAVIARDCIRADGKATCTVQTDVTGAKGKTASKTRVRSTEPGLSTTRITLTGPKGNSHTHEHTVSWGN